MPGYWRRPIGRMYSYNLDLGENYYGHVMDHVTSDKERRARGETPGALSYSERISRKYCGSDRVGKTLSKRILQSCSFRWVCLIQSCLEECQWVIFKF